MIHKLEKQTMNNQGLSVQAFATEDALDVSDVYENKSSCACITVIVNVIHS